MDKEKQDRFNCKHLECCMDGCYCSAGHGSLRTYGICVIPYEQETCAYFERKPKTKTVKITENEVVISKEEYERLKKQDLFMKDYTIVEVLDHEKVKARKETARAIYEKIANTPIRVQLEASKYSREDIVRAVKETVNALLNELKYTVEAYGVDLGETK